jgi:hypothetical protein
VPTTINDIVLVYMDRKPAFFARIEGISPDIKPNWWQVKLLVLTIPIQVTTWILEEIQINGEEFTMGGKPVRLEKVVCPDQGHRGDEKGRKEKPESGGNIIFLGKRRDAKEENR